MSEVIYEKGRMEDLPSITQLFTQAIDYMNRNNIPQWDEVYPNEEVLKEDIRKEQLYVGRVQGNIAVVFVLNLEYDEQYANGLWNYTESSFMVVHRVCVSPKFQNGGIGSKTMKYIEEILKNQQISSIRLDAFSLNPYALKMYERLGYEKVGEADFRMGLFYLMEKQI